MKVALLVFTARLLTVSVLGAPAPGESCKPAKRHPPSIQHGHAISDTQSATLSNSQAQDQNDANDVTIGDFICPDVDCNCPDLVCPQCPASKLFCPETDLTCPECPAVGSLTCQETTLACPDCHCDTNCPACEPTLSCTDVTCPALTCPAIHCPDCPAAGDLTCPEFNCPAVECPTVNCPDCNLADNIVPILAYGGLFSNSPGEGILAGLNYPCTPHDTIQNPSFLFYFADWTASLSPPPTSSPTDLTIGDSVSFAYQGVDDIEGNLDFLYLDWKPTSTAASGASAHLSQWVTLCPRTAYGFTLRLQVANAPVAGVCGLEMLLSNGTGDEAAIAAEQVTVDFAGVAANTWTLQQSNEYMTGPGETAALLSFTLFCTSAYAESNVEAYIDAISLVPQ